MLISSESSTILPGVVLHGQRFAALNERQMIDHVIACLSRGEGGWVVTANLDHLRRMAVGGEYGGLCRAATVVVADGMPLIWASRLQGTPLPERVAGSNLIDSLSEAAGTAGRSIYLLGGAPDTADGAAAVLRERYPKLRVAGTYCPAYGFERDDREVKRIGRMVEQARPDIVFVGLGSPKQERLISRLRDGLPGAWWLGVGISFSFICGQVKRAPRWMQRVGMEWAHRLTQEPGRLSRRYLIEDLPFGLRLLGGALIRRWRKDAMIKPLPKP